MKNNNQNKKKWQINNFLHSRISLLIFLIIVVALTSSVIKELIRQTEIKREINQIEKEIATTENNNEELVVLVDYLNSSEFQEKEIKTRLNMKKSDETAVFIPANNKNNVDYNFSANDAAPDKTKTASISNPHKWLAYFTKE